MWALEPSFAERPTGVPQRWWLVEMEDGEPRRAFLPPQNYVDRNSAVGAVMDPAWRDSFTRWSIAAVPEPVQASHAYVHVYMGVRCHIRRIRR